MPEWRHINAWQEGAEMLSSLVCTNLWFAFLSCPFKSCPVPSCAVLNVPSWPLGKGDPPPPPNFTHTSLRVQGNRMVCVLICQPIPRRTQTPFTNHTLHWIPATVKCVYFLRRFTPTDDVHVRKWGWQVVWQTLPHWHSVWHMVAVMDQRKLALYMHTPLSSSLFFCLFCDLFSCWKLSRCVVLAFVKLETWKATRKHIAIKVGQFSIQSGFLFTCLFFHLIDFIWSCWNVTLLEIM